MRKRKLRAEIEWLKGQLDEADNRARGFARAATFDQVQREADRVIAELHDELAVVGAQLLELESRLPKPRVRKAVAKKTKKVAAARKSTKKTRKR